MANIKKIRTQQGDLAIDYESTENKPTINGVELIGSKTSAELKLMPKPTVDGTQGQLLMSNGDGTVSWITITNGNEVEY